MFLRFQVVAPGCTKRSLEILFLEISPISNVVLCQPFKLKDKFERNESSEITGDDQQPGNQF